MTRALPAHTLAIVALFAALQFGLPAAGNATKKLPQPPIEAIVFAERTYNERDGHWYANLGYYAHDEKYEEAALEYEAYLAENPEDTEVLYDVGMLYQRMERFGDATAMFDRAVAAFINIDH